MKQYEQPDEFKRPQNMHNKNIPLIKKWFHCCIQNSYYCADCWWHKGTVVCNI